MFGCDVRIVDGSGAAGKLWLLSREAGDVSELGVVDLLLVEMFNKTLTLFQTFQLFLDDTTTAFSDCVLL